ncbi:MAG: GH1 family beta-glucosidase [Actinomycetota bacterium]
MTAPVDANASTSERAPEAERLTFPTGFVWGSATSSYQIEGASEADGRGVSIWDTFCRTEGAIKDGSDGSIACGHYDRMADDVAMMSDLGLDAYRFSIAWPRVVPTGRGEVNPAGLDFYERLVDTLLAEGITPMPTLYHWDLPQQLQDEGGWAARSTAQAFAEYTSVVVERLGDRIATWTTLNEPFVSANHGYVTGEHAPGIRSLRTGFAASHHLLLAHGLAGQVIRDAAPEAELAIVINFTPAEPRSDHPADLAAHRVRDDIENRWYSDPVAGLGYPEHTGEVLGWDQSEVIDGDLDLIAQPIDLLGINYYTRQVVGAPRDGESLGDEPAPRPHRYPDTAMGWEIHPPSLGRLLRELDERYHFPKLMITENGCAMPDLDRVDGRPDGQVLDLDRIDYVHRHLRQVHGAIEDGVPVVGYLAWSLMDNFEWAWGYTGRFGLVEIDFETLERRPKRSADWFAQVIRDHAIDDLVEPCEVTP